MQSSFHGSVCVPAAGHMIGRLLSNIFELNPDPRPLVSIEGSWNHYPMKQSKLLEADTFIEIRYTRSSNPVNWTRFRRLTGGRTRLGQPGGSIRFERFPSRFSLRSLLLVSQMRRIVGIHI